MVLFGGQPGHFELISDVGIFGGENLIVMTKKYPREEFFMKKRGLFASTVLRLKVETAWTWPKQRPHDKQLEFRS